MSVGRWVLSTSGGSLAIAWLLMAPVAAADQNDQVISATRTAVAEARATDTVANDCAIQASRGRPCTPLPTVVPTATPTAVPSPTPAPTAASTDTPEPTPTPVPLLTVGSDPLHGYVRPSPLDPDGSLGFLELALPQGRWTVSYDTSLCAPPQPWTNVVLVLDEESNRPITVADDDGAMCALAGWMWKADVPCASVETGCDAVADGDQYVNAAAPATGPPVDDTPMPTDFPTPVPVPTFPPVRPQPVPQPAPQPQIQYVDRVVYVTPEPVAAATPFTYAYATSALAPEPTTDPACSPIDKLPSLHAELMRACANEPSLAPTPLAPEPTPVPDPSPVPFALPFAFPEPASASPVVVPPIVNPVPAPAAPAAPPFDLLGWLRGLLPHWSIAFDLPYSPSEPRQAYGAWMVSLLLAYGKGGALDDLVKERGIDPVTPPMPSEKDLKAVVF